MRSIHVFALAVLLIFAVLLMWIAPFLVESVLPPLSEVEQGRQLLRRMCQDTLARQPALYGDRPVEEWPDECARMAYRDAQRLLAELEEGKP